MSDTQPYDPTRQPVTPPGAAYVQPSSPANIPYGQALAVPAPQSVNSDVRGMYTAAAIVNWVVLALVIVGTAGIGVIAAAWFVPMTILIHKGAKGPYKHTALGVCTLIFCNFISGILMLVDDSGRPTKPLT